MIVDLDNFNFNEEEKKLIYEILCKISNDAILKKAIFNYCKSMIGEKK